MKFYFRRCSLFFVIVIICKIKASSDDESNDDLSRTFEFQNSPSGRPCRYRRQQGHCQLRSKCRRPTRNTCSFGLNPTVCCLDDPALHTTSTTSTTIKPKTTKQAAGNSINNAKPMDLTYPECGFRAPTVSSTTARSDQSSVAGRQTTNDRRTGWLGRRTGKQRTIDHVIVGGVASNPNSWPWMIAIFKEPFSGGTKRFLCGASLISRRYVLTAAHCFDGERGNIVASKFFVTAGAHTTKDGTEYPVENIAIHPEYKTKQYYNDIALLKVAKDVVLGKKVHPVCLPSDGLRSRINPDEKNVTVTGWGDTSFGGVSSKVLQEVQIPIVPLKKCNDSYSKIPQNGFPSGITNLFICAGLEEGGKDACQGDSGGPMTSKLKNSAYVQLGVVSFGNGCAQPGFPGVYTRLSQYTKWLYDNTDLGR